MNLAKHISGLLKFHECVIIPEFGGFISNYIPAQFDQIRNTFHPPSKEVVFNTKINKNDGLLINHLVEAEKIGYHQAQLAVINFVDRLFEALNKGEKVELDELGSFEYDRSGSIVFHPTSIFELIETYGLTGFSFPMVHESKQASTFQPRPAIRALNNRKDVIKIAASITLLLALSLFPVKNEKLNLHSSVLNPMQFLNEGLPVKTSVDKTVSLSTEVAEFSFVEELKPTPYILVGGSFQHFENANQLQLELLNNGYNPEILDMGNGFYRVVIDSFTDKKNAVDAMKSYLSNNRGSEAWVSAR